MNLFGLNFGKKKTNSNNQDALVNSYCYNGQNFTLSSFLGNDSNITEEDVMQIPAIQAGLELITGSIAQLPIKLYKPADLNDLQEVSDDYRVDLINKETNETLTGYNFKKKITRDVILYGVSKSYIHYENNTSNVIDAIYPLDTKDLIIDVYVNNGYKHYGIVTLNNASGNYHFYDDLLLSVLKDTTDGITGNGIINNNAKTLKLALAQQQYEQGLLENGAMPISVLETDSKMNDIQIQRLRASWRKLYETTQNAGKTVILEQGLHFKPASINPDNLQLKDGKASVISNIARMLNIPESMINSSANKYDSNEQNNMYFLQYCLSPILVSIETALDKILLTEEEKKNGYCFKTDTSSLLKATVEERTNMIIQEFNNGVITNFQAKRALGSNIKKEEKEFYKLTTGQVLYQLNNQTIINPNTGTVIDANNGKIVNGGGSNDIDND